MTLNKKFLDLAFLKITSEELADKSVQVTEDFAIGFAEWIHSNAGYAGNGHYVVIGNTSYHTIPKLLEIYKKEKGL